VHVKRTELPKNDNVKYWRDLRVICEQNVLSPSTIESLELRPVMQNQVSAVCMSVLVQIQNLCYTWKLTLSVSSWSEMLLEGLIFLQLFNTTPAFYGARRFFTTFTSACYLFLS